MKLPLTYGLLVSAVLLAAAGAAPPGRPHVLTIEGDSTVAFAPQAGLEPVKIDYKARVEYLVETRIGDEAMKAAGAGSKSTTRKAPAVKVKSKAGKTITVKTAGRIDLSIHAAEVTLRQNGQPVMDVRMSRARFQGQLQPGLPPIDVTANNAPPRLNETLRTFDVTAATLLLDEDARVIGRNFWTDAPFHALVETILSIHTPIPHNVDVWEAPTQLAMGNGQTARGTLRFEKDKASLAATEGLVKVKVSGTLKAEGIVAGRFIKDGAYTVTGEQSYDPETQEWRSVGWSVAIDNDLANPAGQTVARARGTMLVQSKRLDERASEAETPGAKSGP